MSLFGLDQATKVFLHGKPADMRKGFDGLCGLVLEHIQIDPRVVNGLLARCWCAYFLIADLHTFRLCIVRSRRTLLPV